MGQTVESARMSVQVKHTYKNALDLNDVTDDLTKSYVDTLSNGTGANKAQVVFHDRRSLLTTATEELDLAGTLVNAFGVVTFTKIKEIVIKVNTVTAGYRLLVGGAASNAFETFVGAAGDIIKIGAGGILALSSPVDGYVVTANTADLLKIDNPSGGTVEYEIWIVGEGSIA